MNRVNEETMKAMENALEQAVAVYHLLHAHARGETDLTEDQLANVVTTVSMTASDVLRQVRGGGSRDDGGCWVALQRARRPRRRRRLDA